MKIKNKKIIIISSIIGVGLLFIIAAYTWYYCNVYKSSVKQDTKINIELGSGSNKIAMVLKEHGVISNELAFKMYVRWNKISNFQAGEYDLTTGMTVPEIVNYLQTGKVYSSDSINITFLEGKNMRWIASKIAEDTNNTENDVYTLLQDKQYIQELINKYWFLTDKVQNVDIYYPLEGYLYPDTYTFENKDVSVKEIFNILLNQTDKILSEYKTQIQNSGLNVHQVLTIASIVELEGKTATDRSGIARVIYNRLKNNMKIGSDVTTYYGIKVDMGERNLYKDEINTYNPYNTRGPNMNGKLPVGPIASVSKESINATLHPSSSNYLYFVADINGNIYFTENYDKHQAKIQELRKQGLWYNYE